MPQILKEEIKKKILDNALQSFVSNGYKNTSMKAIALKSQISVGNIYNYFKDKETLYDALVLSVFEEINELFESPPKNPFSGVDEKIEAFIEIYNSNNEIFMMLLENSGNTKFENLKNTIIDNFAAAVDRFRHTATKKPLKPEGKIFLKAFAGAFVNGIIIILAQPANENLKLEVLFKFSSVMKNSMLDKFI